MKRLMPILLFVVIHYSGLSQQDVNWGKLEGRSGSLIDVFPINDQDFYTLRWKGGSALGGYYLSKFEDLKESKSKRISIAVNYNIANFEGAILVDEKPAIILSNRKDGIDYIYLQPYGYDLQPKGEAKLLAEYEIGKGMTKSPIRIIQSKDKKYFAVLWLLVAKKKEHDRYGYAVFDNKFKEIDQGEYEVPFESRYSQITDNLLSNTGHYFFVVKEWTKNEERKVGGAELLYKAMHIFQVSNDDGLEQYTLSLKGKRVESLSINTDDDSVFTITGVYGSKDFRGVNGVFYMQLNFRKKEILKEGFKEFAKDFITEDYTERELDRLERRTEKGKDEPALYNFKLRNAELLSDGSIVGLMEQQYVIIRSFSDARSMINYSYTYYFNDLILFRIDQNGDFVWLDKIKKTQVSMNDGGPYSSYSIAVKDNRMYLLFNDSRENYDAAGNYKNGFAYQTRFGIKSNVLALVEVELLSGLQTRTIVTESKDQKLMPQPRQFSFNRLTNEFMLFSSFKGKEAYGLMKIK